MEETIVSTAERASIRIGCSGWVYKHWRGLFYPEGLPQTRWFERYAEEFDTVEINNSFYHLPKPATFEKWRKQAPPGFCYAVKANRFLTQAKKLKDCEEPMERMMSAVEHLGDRLGPMLYQLPPNLKINLERLESFLTILPPDVTSVFEFREKSWYVSETYDLLDRFGASFCIHDMPGSTSERIAVGPIVYVRFHGTSGHYAGSYPDERLEKWACTLTEQWRAGRQVYAYFNNDPDAVATQNAQALRRLVLSKIGT
jgi:uncharacterized protein YecE (DUF72 family)